MSIASLVAAALFLGIVAYGVLGGADFGSGFYDLTAGDAHSGAALRTLVDHSIGPVWEANHVWLIYVMVVWWTGFPVSFAAAMSTLMVPMFLALLGIVLRGAGFAFRKYAETLAQARLFGAVFAGASLITPFFLGTVVGAIASGRVPAGGRGDAWSSWLGATSLIGGVVAVLTCIFLAGVFLVAEAHRGGQDDLEEGLRRTTLTVGVLTGMVVFLALLPLQRDAPTLAAGLQGRGAPLVAISGVAGLATLLLLLRRKPGAARFTAVTAVACVLLGWGVAQYPWILVDQLSITQAAGAPATMRALLVAAAMAAVIVVPPLAYLFHLTQSDG